MEKVRCCYCGRYYDDMYEGHLDNGSNCCPQCEKEEVALVRGGCDMKKLCTLLIALVVVLLGFVLLPTEARAVETEGPLTYVILNESAIIVGCDSSVRGDLVIPSTLGGFPVTKIDAKAFTNCQMTSITIPDSITHIGNQAFYNCFDLAGIDLGNGVTTIGSYAFCGCNSLTSITIPDSVTSLGPDALQSCDNLVSVTLGNGITIIPSFAFCGCSKLTSVSFGDNITAIDSFAFYECTGLNSISIPAGITRIGPKAFEGCTGLTTITIPDSISDIDGEAFKGCYSLSDVYYGGSRRQWDNIQIQENNDYLISAALHCAVNCDNGHHWDNGKVTNVATCKETGVKTYTCTVCNETKTEAIAKLGTHSYDNGKVTKEATCKEEGVKTYTCTVCGATKTEAIAKLTTHTWDSGKVTKEATCKEEGVKTYTCTVCKETKTEAIAKLMTHTPGAEATATTPQVCTVCGKELKPATGVTEPPATEPPATEPTVTPTQPEGNKNPDDGEFPIMVVIAIVVLGGGGATAGVILWKKKH